VLLPEGFRGNESSDFAAIYEPLSKNLMNNDGYTINGIFSIYYPPGYPIILCGLYTFSFLSGISDQLILSLFQLLTTTFSALILFKTASLFFDKFVALLCTLLWISYPFNLWITKQPNTEIPFIFFLFLGFYFLLVVIKNPNNKKFSLLLAGIIFGIATLIRPVSVFLPIFIGISLFFVLKPITVSRKIVNIILFLVGFVLVLTPWEVVAYHNTGKIILVSENSAMAVRGGLVFAISEDTYKEKVDVPGDVKEFMVKIVDNYSSLETTSKTFKFVAEYALKEPLTIVKLFVIKALRSWYATDRQSYEGIILLVQIPYILLLLAGTYLGFLKGGVNRIIVTIVWVITIYFWAMSILVTSTLRYMIPTIGILWLVTGYLLEKIIDQIRKKKLLKVV